MTNALSPSPITADFPASPLLLENDNAKTLIAYQQEGKMALQALQGLYENRLPLLNLPFREDDLNIIEQAASTITSRSDTLVLVGIGGSSLGAEALAALSPTGHPVQFKVMDNPDPESFAAIRQTVNPSTTSWIFISKSGGTLETVAQVMMILDWLEHDLGREEIAARCLIITEPKDSSLNRLATHYAIPVLEHDPELGGRWTCVSLIGLIPAAALGLDARSLRMGTKAMLEHALRAPLEQNMPLLGALDGFHQAKQGRMTHAIMPYADRLECTASWCRQLISESLGKNGKGITPLAALGTVDQHSMLQLLLDGPDDKYFTVITIQQQGRGDRIPAHLAQLCGLDYLGGKTLGDVLHAFQEGTIASLKAANRPVRTLHLPEINAFYLGALLMYFMAETIFLAALLGVNAFDQPAVEDSKNRAKAVLGA